MTPKQIELVQASFARVAPNAEVVAALFYERLFEIAPEIRSLFEDDMSEQGRKLIGMLAAVVSGLSNLETILPAAKALAVRHVSYGVKPGHYVPVGEALIWTLEKGIGADFTSDTRDAWLAAYRVLSGAMIAEAYGMATA